MMRKSLTLWVILLTLLTAIGCQSFRLEIGFKQPADLTATAQALPTKPQLGRLAFLQGGDIWVKELPDGEERRLTRDGHNTEPHWSASGEWLAFRKDNQIWVMRVDRTEAHALDGTVEGDVIAWSPAEDRLAYTTSRGLRVEEANGSGRKEIVSKVDVIGSPTQPRGVTAIAWSPDGEWIAFEKRDYTPPQPVSSQGLWRVKVDGSKTAEVLLNPDPSRAHSYLAGWSPDGQHLLFWQAEDVRIRLAGEGLPLMAISITGGAAMTVTEKPMLLHNDFLSWSPDGRRLAFVDGDRRATWEDKTIAVSTLAGGTQSLPNGDRANLFPSWSPDGRWIAFASGPAAPGIVGGESAKIPFSQRRIWLVSPDGTSMRHLTDSSGFRDERPQWSMDGSTILFARLRGEEAQLWLMRADGSEQRRLVDLTPSPDWYGDFGYLGWSHLYDWWRGSTTRNPIPPASVTQPVPSTVPTPVSTPILETAPPPVPIQEGAAITEAGTYVAEIESGRLWRVADPYPIWRWSPDGKTLARASTCCDGVGGLDLIDLATGSAQRLTSGNFAAIAWSPDGKEIAFTRKKERYSKLTDTEGIYTINRDGSGLKQRSFLPGILAISWSPRGERIAFKLGAGNIFIMNYAADQITEVMRSDAIHFAFAWSPDGKSLFLNNPDGLHMYDVATAKLQQISSEGIDNSVPWSDGPIFWSPDGSKIISWQGRVPLRPFVMDARSLGLPQPLPQVLDASWSPGGQRMAYLNNGCEGGDWDIYSVEAGGSSGKRLTNTPKVLKERAIWSPKGAGIAFSTLKEIMVVDADSAEVRTLATRGDGSSSALHLHDSPWSPDGRYLVFEVSGGHSLCFTGKE